MKEDVYKFSDLNKEIVKSADSLTEQTRLFIEMVERTKDCSGCAFLIENTLSNLELTTGSLKALRTRLVTAAAGASRGADRDLYNSLKPKKWLRYVGYFLTFIGACVVLQKLTHLDPTYDVRIVRREFFDERRGTSVYLIKRNFWGSAVGEYPMTFDRELGWSYWEDSELHRMSTIVESSVGWPEPSS